MDYDFQKHSRVELGRRLQTVFCEDNEHYFGRNWKKYFKMLFQDYRDLKYEDGWSKILHQTIIGGHGGHEFDEDTSDANAPYATLITFYAGPDRDRKGDRAGSFSIKRRVWKTHVLGAMTEKVITLVKDRYHEAIEWDDMNGLHKLLTRLLDKKRADWVLEAVKPSS